MLVEDELGGLSEWAGEPMAVVMDWSLESLNTSYSSSPFPSGFVSCNST